MFMCTFPRNNLDLFESRELDVIESALPQSL